MTEPALVPVSLRVQVERILTTGRFLRCATVLLSLAAPASVAAQTPIACGETLAGSIGVAAEIDQYSFGATAGEAVTITAVATSGLLAARLDLYTPGGTFITSNGFGNTATGPVVLTVTGTYTIRVHDYNSTQTGAYNLNLQFTTGRCGSPITCGQLLTGRSITDRAQQQTYTFSANAGEAVTVTAVATTGLLAARLDLYAPTGVFMTSNGFGNTATGPVILPTTGTYTVAVRDYNLTQAGNYNLGLQFTTGRCGSPITCGQTLTGRSVTERAQQDTYTFSATAGEAVTVTAVATTGLLAARLDLYAPTGVFITSNAFGNTATGPVILPTTGTYTVAVRDYTLVQAGAYNLNLQFTTGRCASPITCGSMLTSRSIAERAQQQTYAFSATAGEAVTVTAVATSGLLAARLDLYAPTGVFITSNAFGNTATGPVILPTTGTYTVAVRDYTLVQAGTYNLNLQFTTGRCGRVIGSETLGAAIDGAARQESYSFCGTVNTSIVAAAVATSGLLAARLDLYGPTGAFITSNGFGNGPTSSVVLQATGTYTILVRDYVLTRSGTYNVTLSGPTCNPPGPPTINITSPTSDSTFIGTGAQLTLSGIASDPDGTVASVSWSTDRGFSGGGSGATSWFASEIPLLAGVNTITLTATDDDALTGTDTLVVTVSTLSYFLAEGATGGFFDTDILIANPHTAPAPYSISYLKAGGATVETAETLPATSRKTIRVDTVPGLEATAFSAVVTSTSGLPLVVERTMRWDATGYGSHTDKASAGPARKWYFAEGSQGFFFTYLLLANASPTANRAIVDWLREGDTTVTRIYDLLPNSRTTIDAGADAALVNRSFGIVVTFDQPGAAERAMYFSAPGGALFEAGHESAGVNAPSTTWFLAEGATGPFFETFILLANPNPTNVTATLTFLSSAAAPVVRTVLVPANGRQTVDIEALTPPAPELANVAVATQVTSPQPIVVERAQYWPYSPPLWYEAHNSFGLTATATKWGLAEGRVGNPAGLDAANYQTYILLANPGGVTANATVTFLREDGTTLVKMFAVPPNRRFNVQVTGPGGNVPELNDTTFGAVVTSDQPIAVERAMYSSTNGVWSAGSNATATRLP